MPLPVGPTIAPGIALPTSGYPQYGVGGGSPGSSSGWKIVVAQNALVKQDDINQGYLAWFTSRSAAQNFISSESSTYGSGTVPNPLSGLADVGDFFHRLTEASTWTRVGEVGLGAILLWAGIRAMTRNTPVGATARKSATKPVRKVATKVGGIVAPEVRLGARTVAKRAAPKTTARVASHRAQVAKYGAKKPYTAPAPKTPSPPRVTHRVSHIYHHKGPTP